MHKISWRLAFLYALTFLSLFLFFAIDEFNERLVLFDKAQAEPIGVALFVLGLIGWAILINRGKRKGGGLIKGSAIALAGSVNGAIAVTMMQPEEWNGDALTSLMALIIITILNLLLFFRVILKWLYVSHN